MRKISTWMLVASLVIQSGGALAEGELVETSSSNVETYAISPQQTTQPNPVTAEMTIQVAAMGAENTTNLNPTALGQNTVMEGLSTVINGELSHNPLLATCMWDEVLKKLRERKTLTSFWRWDPALERLGYVLQFNDGSIVAVFEVGKKDKDIVVFSTYFGTKKEWEKWVASRNK